MNSHFQRVRAALSVFPAETVTICFDSLAETFEVNKSLLKSFNPRLIRSLPPRTVAYLGERRGEEMRFDADSYEAVLTLVTWLYTGQLEPRPELTAEQRLLTMVEMWVMGHDWGISELCNTALREFLKLLRRDPSLQQSIDTEGATTPDSKLMPSYRYVFELGTPDMQIYQLLIKLIVLDLDTEEFQNLVPPYWPQYVLRDMLIALSKAQGLSGTSLLRTHTKDFRYGLDQNTLDLYYTLFAKPIDVQEPDRP